MSKGSVSLKAVRRTKWLEWCLHIVVFNRFLDPDDIFICASQAGESVRAEAGEKFFEEMQDYVQQALSPIAASCRTAAVLLVGSNPRKNCLFL